MFLVLPARLFLSVSSDTGMAHENDKDTDNFLVIEGDVSSNT
jgi:hypothetical protein